MAVFKCKMCGGSLEIDNETVGTCEYCGTKQTLPRLSDDRKVNLYDRANHFRRNNEFDKAMGIYEQILDSDNTDAEAYWSLVLCRFGIEYVEDPSTHKRIPTVNRAQFTSIFDDDNYRSALQYADVSQRRLYEEEAKAISEIQKGILAISRKEEPFDVFICYKETDQNGRRTMDSVLAQDLYDQLTREGFKVFFARITLEDKLGTAYEPYIFAALNSAKVMVVLGTRADHFSAVWVKNEWSRYLSLIRAGAEKYLIPAYRDMDPYDLPEEFSHLQAQDMGKLGFMQDLVRGIKKLTHTDQPKQTVVRESANSAALLKRAFLFLEDGDWQSAGEYCEKVLDNEPENAQAYLGKLMVELQVSSQEALAEYSSTFDDHNSYQKAYRFGDTQLKAQLEDCTRRITERLEQKRLEGIYTEACAALEAATTGPACKKAAELFASISNYKDAAALQQQSLDKIEICRKDNIYNQAKDSMSQKTIRDHEAAITQLEKILGWRDADQLIAACREELVQLKADHEAALAAQAEKDRLAREEAIAYRRKRDRIIRIVSVVAALCVICVLVYVYVLDPMLRYNKALSLSEAGQYDAAVAAFTELGDYKDSKQKIIETQYAKAKVLVESGQYDEAVAIFSRISHYSDSATQVLGAKYLKAAGLLSSEAYDEAAELFEELGEYKDSVQQRQEAYTTLVLALIGEKKLDEAEAKINTLSGDRSLNSIMDTLYVAIQEAYSAEKNYVKVLTYYGKTKAFRSGSDVHKELAYKAAPAYIKDKAFDKALQLYKIASGYQDADQLWNDTYYQKGLYLIKQKNYDDAITALEKVSNYADSQEQIKEAKYLYVKDNYDQDDYTTYDYMKELKAANYKDSVELFNKLYAWKVSIIANDDKDDDKTAKTSISVFDPVFFHITLSGGEPGASTTLSAKYYHPNGTTGWYTFDNPWYGGTGWYGWENGIYNNPAYGNRGTLTVEIYDGNGNLLGSHSVKMTS